MEFDGQSLPFPGLQLVDLRIEHALSIMGDTKGRFKQYQNKLRHLFTIEASRRENVHVAPLLLPQKRNVVDVESPHQQSKNKRMYGTSYIKCCFVG